MLDYLNLMEDPQLSYSQPSLSPMLLYHNLFSSHVTPQKWIMISQIQMLWLAAFSKGKKLMSEKCTVARKSKEHATYDIIRSFSVLSSKVSALLGFFPPQTAIMSPSNNCWIKLCSSSSAGK